MPYSSNQKNVVLEVGETIGTTSVETQSPSGFGETPVFGDCGNDLCEDANWDNGTYYAWPGRLNAQATLGSLAGWSNMSVDNVFFVGGGLGAPDPPFPSMPSYTLYPGTENSVRFDTANLFDVYDEYLRSYLIVFDFGKFTGGGPDTLSMSDFNGPLISENPIVVDNRFATPWDRGATEQGRMLYGIPYTQDAQGLHLSFEICEGESTTENPHRLVCKSSGTDDLGQVLAQYYDGVAPFGPNSSNEDIALFFNNFRWFISPFVHSGSWVHDVTNTPGGSLNFDSNRKFVHCSYITYEENNYYGSMMGEQDVLGIRSSDNMFESCEYNSYDTKGYELTITVDSLQDCVIQVLTYNKEIALGIADGDVSQSMQFAFEDMGLDTSGGAAGWVWQEISEPGTYTFCVPWQHDTVITEDAENEVFNDQYMDAPGCWSGNARIKLGPGDYYHKVYCRNNYKFLKLRSNPAAASYQCSISFFELKNSGYNLVTEQIPYYSTTYIDQPVYKYTYLDIFDRKSVPISLNYTSGDLTDPGKKTTGYSKTFELPSTPHNNKVLKNLIGDCSVKDLEAISWRKARVKSDGVVVFEGFARIEKATTTNGGRYSCHILQDASAWPELIGEKKLCDLAFGTHNKDYATVVDSWDKTVDNQAYVYPAISYGKWGTSGDGDEDEYSNQPKTIDDFHPAVYVKAIVNEIFEDIGYTIESKFFNTERFKRMIIPYTSGEDYAPTGSLFGQGGDYSGTAQKSNQQALPDMPDSDSGQTVTNKRYYPVLTTTENIDLMTPGVSYATQNGYKAPFSGEYNIWYNAEISQSQGGNNYGRWTAYVHVNGQAMRPNGYGSMQAYWDSIYDYSPNYYAYNGGSGNANVTWYASNSSGTTWDYRYLEVYNVYLEQGDEVQISHYGRNHSLYWGNWSDIKNQTFFVYPTPGQNFNPGGQEVSLGQVLGCSVKQKDLLKGLTEIFNLYWHTDTAAKTIIVEPYSDYFGSGKLVDWTNKVDKKNRSDKFLIDELAKRTNFSYGNDTSDKLVQSNNAEFADAYGDDVELWSLSITNNEKYRKGLKEMGTEIFAPTMQLYTPSSGNGDLTWCTSTGSTSPKIPAMWGGNEEDVFPWVNTTERPNRETKFKLRILNYWGISPQCGTWQMKDDNGDVNNKTGFPYAYTYNDIHAADYNAVYGVNATDNLSWYGMPQDDSSPAYQRGLYDTFWAEYYDKISGGAALRTCFVDLNNADIAGIDFRDVFKIDTDGGIPTYWTLNKIIDYKPGVDSLTKVELVEWKHEVNTDSSLGPPIYETNYGSLGDPNAPTGEWGSGGMPGGAPGAVNENTGALVPGKKYTVDYNMQILPSNKKVGLLSTTNNLNINRIKNDIALQRKGKKVVKKDVLSVNSKSGVSIGSSKNRVISDGIALGKKLSANKGQVVIGQLNRINGGDVFQVGGGYYDDTLQKNIRRNVLSVTKEGDFNIYGGEVVAEFTTGDLKITGDIYYTDKDGNKKKVYLDSIRRQTDN